MAASARGINLGHLLESGQFSDLTLVCGDKQFNVHKAVVCAQCRVLAAAIREPFQASKTGKIVIEEYDTDTVEKMVEFLYTGDYKPQFHQDEETNDDEVPEEDPVQHVLVNSIADYYDIKALADLSKEKLQHALRDANKSHLLEAATVALSRTGDTTVHAMLAEEIAKNIRQHLESGELAALVGGFAIEIVNRVVAADDESRLLYKAKLADAEIDSEREREERKQIQANFDNCRKSSAQAVNLVA
ncbi:Speckle-type POZ protein-like [Beauveria bassiana]|nr:Speckle-type POZ protein-like [Beauveria bassiana]